jgi:hypothetical protein
MLTTLVLVLAAVVIGTRLSDGLRLRQEESILRRLPLDQAHDYYELLKRRVRRVRIMRALTLASVFLCLMAARRRLVPPPPPPQDAAAWAPAAPPTNTDGAKALAQAALRRHAERERLDLQALELAGVSGDDKHPWVFDYRWKDGRPERLRLYVSRGGQVEVHRVLK